LLGGEIQSGAIRPCCRPRWRRPAAGPDRGGGV